MRDENETPEDSAPEVGIGSPDGPRWFISRCPEWTTTVEPETKTILGDTVVIKKAKRLTFKMQAKPHRFIGRGYNEKGNEMGDKNQNRLWGVLYVEGESDDDKRIIDYLRKHENYRMTVQDNAPEANPLLKELTYNPAGRGDKPAEAVAVRPGRVPSGDKRRDPAAPAEDASTARPAARIGVKKK